MWQNEMHFDVAIIGAGFSGTMVAVHLFKDGVAFRINWGGGEFSRSTERVREKFVEAAPESPLISRTRIGTNTRSLRASSTFIPPYLFFQ